MHPDLVQPTGFRHGPHDAVPAAVVTLRGRALTPAQHLEACPRGRAVGMHRALEPDARGFLFAQAQQRRVHRERIPRGPAPNDGQIFLADASAHHVEGEPAGGGGGLGDEQQAAGLAVQTVDERDLAAVGDLVGEQGAQGVEERGGAAGPRRMDEQVRRLADHHPIGVLGHDRNRKRQRGRRKREGGKVQRGMER